MSQYHCKYATSAYLEFSFLAWLLFVIEFKYQSSFWTIFPKKKLYTKNSPSTKRNSKLLGMLDMFIILTKVMVSWIYIYIYIYVKTFQTVYFKYVQLILLKLYSIKLLNESLHSHYLFFYSMDTFFFHLFLLVGG